MASLVYSLRKSLESSLNLCCELPANLPQLCGFSLESTINFCNLILEEKRRIKDKGLNSLDIDLSLSRLGGNFQTIDFVRFHRIVSSGIISVQVIVSKCVGVQLAVFLADEINYPPDVQAVDLRECQITHPLIDELRNPLDSSAECSIKYALLAESPFHDRRNKLWHFWELVGILRPLDNEFEMQAEAVRDFFTIQL